MNKVRLVSITLETASGKKQEFSIEEAKDLYKQLQELFGKDEKPTVVKEKEYVPLPYPVYPLAPPIWIRPYYYEPVTPVYPQYPCTGIYYSSTSSSYQAGESVTLSNMVCDSGLKVTYEGKVEV